MTAGDSVKYAILADVHSNLEALNAVLAEAKTAKVDAYLCAGDVVGYGADPMPCLARFREFDITTIAGNHDWACVGKVNAAWFNRYARTAVEWTRKQLGFNELNILRTWRATHVEKLFTLVHGTLRAPEKFDYLFEAAQALETAVMAKTPLCFVGHTHRPFVFEIDPRGPTVVRMVNTTEELTHLPLTLDHAKYIINPGSVGQPRDGDPRASFAVLDTDESWIEICRVEYDISTTQKKIREAGLPAIFADRLALGQ